MTEYHVKQNGQGEGGTLPTLAAAVAIARPGDIVIVHEGIYPAGFKPPAGTTWQAADGERAVIDGGWKGKEMSSAAAGDTVAAW